MLELSNLHTFMLFWILKLHMQFSDDDFMIYNGDA